MKVKIKKFRDNAQLPQKMTEGAACFDVFASDIEKVEEDYYICKLGIGLTPPKGYKVVLVPRSSLTKTRWMIINTPAQGDEDFYHEYQLRFRAFPGGLIWNTNDLYYEEFPFKVGDRIGQMFIEKVIDFEFEEVDELIVTDRLGGYGSTNL
jgi:dUTP pyrophosphatase